MKKTFKQYVQEASYEDYKSDQRTTSSDAKSSESAPKGEELRKLEKSENPIDREIASLRKRIAKLLQQKQRELDSEVDRNSK